MQFIYCPKCGEKLTTKEAGDDGLVPFCVPCNRYYFDIFPSCVIVLVANEFDEVVLLRQSYLSDKYHTFVAGYMCVGETAENAAVREVKEEIGLVVQNQKDTRIWGLKNLTDMPWYRRSPGGKEEVRMKGEVIPVIRNNSIKFGTLCVGVIK